ncbi:MAG: Stp1/IreP family PP2C-type Ser/Thr phosphatase [Clostridia bacterium]
MKIVGGSDIGRLRLGNEDAFCFGELESNAVWAVVCDGMGGASGGKIASQITTDMVGKKIEKCYKPLMQTKSIQNVILSAVTTANVAVYDRALADESLLGMGTTIVAAIIKDNIACIAHVGDSRAYILNAKKEIFAQITKDHSLVQEMLDAGQITQEQFEHHPIKNIITRAVGVKEKIDIEFDIIEVEDEDVILICTDGLTGELEKEEIFKIFKQSDFDDLIVNYINVANENGGRDNITAIAVKC